MRSLILKKIKKNHWQPAMCQTLLAITPVSAYMILFTVYKKKIFLVLQFWKQIRWEVNIRTMSHVQDLLTFLYGCQFIPTPSLSRVLMCIPGCLGTHYVDQVVLELTEICLPLPRVGIKGLLHCVQQMSFEYLCLSLLSLNQSLGPSVFHWPPGYFFMYLMQLAIRS